MKKTLIQLRILGEILLGCVIVATAHETTLSLAGAWKFRLDADNVGVAQSWYTQGLDDTVQLPRYHG